MTATHTYRSANGVALTLGARVTVADLNTVDPRMVGTVGTVQSLTSGSVWVRVGESTIGPYVPGELDTTPSAENMHTSYEYVPATLDAVIKVAHTYGASVHGDLTDKYGRHCVDLEFPTVHQAASFHHTVGAVGDPALGEHAPGWNMWFARVVGSFERAVTVTVQLDD